MKPLAIITGVGPGTGASLVRRFHDGGYQVAMLARNAARLDALAGELPEAFAVPCDVADPAALQAALEGIEARAGAPKVAVHNAVGGAFANFLDVDPAVLERNFQVNVMALMHLGRWAAPRMEKAGGGALIVTGNTSAERGRANFAGFAPTKAAQRILAESMARTMGPRGVHVAYLVIDAAIDLEWQRKNNPEKPDDYFCHPERYRRRGLAHRPPAQVRVVVSFGDPTVRRGLVKMTATDAEAEPDGFQQLSAMLTGELSAPMGEKLGFALVELDRGRVVFEGTPDRSVYNPLGSVHGGYAATLLDSACGLAVQSELAAGRAHTTLELKVSYLRGLSERSGTVRSIGRVLSLGRRVAFAEATLHDGDGRLCATATSTLLLFDVEPGRS